VANTERVRRLTRVAVTATVLMMAVTAGLMVTPGPTARAVDAKAIRVASNNVITDPGTGQPTVVLSMYEDSLCPYCRKFERTFGATVDKLIDTGAVAADYYMVAILDRPNRDYSSRAGAAAYCAADESIDTFRRFHAALYTHQPAESAASFPDDAALIALARQAGAGDATADCINGGSYTATVAGMADATNVEHTPTVRINGQDYELSTPDALVASIKELVGPVPGIDAPTPESTRPS
jgi:protein-disulfide isomerase